MQKIDFTKAWLVRLNGCGFREITSQLERPWDNNFHRLMTAVCYDLMKMFNPHFIYTWSDKIYMYYFPGEYTFTAQLQKIISRIAGFASARLNYYAIEIFGKEQIQDRLRTEDDRIYSDNAYQLLLQGTLYMESILLPFTEPGLAWQQFNHTQALCISTSLRTYAQRYEDSTSSTSSTSSTNTMTVPQLLAFLAENRDKDWEKTPVVFRQGTIFKKKLMPGIGSGGLKTISFTINIGLLDEKSQAGLWGILQKSYLEDGDFNHITTNKETKSNGQ